jgi:hydrogenase nickel incorporation protein HypA/HybF
MHELSIAMSIVDGALEELKQHGAAEAKSLRLRVGRLSGVDKDALLFSYEVACQGTALDGSKLLIEEIDVTIMCPSCRAERAIRCFPMLICSECGAVADHVMHGEELEITGMEILT